MTRTYKGGDAGAPAGTVRRRPGGEGTCAWAGGGGGSRLAPLPLWAGGLWVRIVAANIYRALTTCQATRFKSLTVPLIQSSQAL